MIGGDRYVKLMYIITEFLSDNSDDGSRHKLCSDLSSICLNTSRLLNANFCIAYID